MDIQKELFKLQDIKYKEFVGKLIPSIDKSSIIGVKNPQVRILAKEFAKYNEVNEFLNLLPHKYYEENNIHAFIIENIKDFDKCIDEVEKFLPYVDNWATCDCMSPKIFKKNLDKLYDRINIWINSNKTYTIRFAIEMLMNLYLDENFSKEHLRLVAKVRSDEYYVKMMVAWYFATALAKQYEDTIGYIENRKLEKWIHNKTIQKSIESYRISQEKKDYLRNLKIC